MKKIAFTGTHGTGKTTLAYGTGAELQKLGYNTKIINETARETQFNLNDETTYEAQVDIIARQVRNELDASIRPVDYIVTDRTVMDAVAYTKNAEMVGTIELGWSQALFPLARKWLDTYDLIFYVEPPFDIEEKVREETVKREEVMEKINEMHVGEDITFPFADGVRWASYQAMRAINDILYTLYSDNGVPIVVISSSRTLQERLPFVIETVLGVTE